MNQTKKLAIYHPLKQVDQFCKDKILLVRIFLDKSRIFLTAKKEKLLYLKESPQKIKL
jgi:hypothetical protein